MQVIYGGLDAWDALAYGEQNPSNVEYFKNQIQSIGNSLTEFGQKFYSDAQQLYDRFNDSTAMQMFRNASKAAKTLFQPNIVKSIYELDDIQTASFVMQRWIMANPVVREMYHDQRCDGYSETYVDVSPKDIGENHYDYRRVMDGVVQETEDGWFYKLYPDEIHQGDRELIHSEKVDILSTWEIVEMFMKAGKEDPTSPYGTAL